MGRRRVDGATIGRAVTAAAVVLLPIAACGSAAESAAPAESPPSVVGLAAEPASPPAGAAESPTPSPPPTPITTTETVTETEPVPYDTVEREDPGLERGTTVVGTAGRHGERTLTYEVTYTDGAESGRNLVADEITTEPVDEIVLVGTYEPPPPEPEEASAGEGCDPNYEGACVPIASDVDCASGSGNGPAYVEGPVYVVGGDPYDLDRDGDGVACERG